MKKIKVSRKYVKRYWISILIFGAIFLVVYGLLKRDWESIASMGVMMTLLSIFIFYLRVFPQSLAIDGDMLMFRDTTAPIPYKSSVRLSDIKKVVAIEKHSYFEVMVDDKYKFYPDNLDEFVEALKEGGVSSDKIVYF